MQLLRRAVNHPARGVHHGTLAGLAHPQLAKALSALHARPGEPWPLERLAAQAGMSRSAFAAAFKHAVGTTPAAYVLDWRLGLAATRLREGRAVKQVVHERSSRGRGRCRRGFGGGMGCLRCDGAEMRKIAFSGTPGRHASEHCPDGGTLLATLI